MPKELWKPGQSGNPAGRPKGRTLLTEILRDFGDIEDVKSGETMIARKHALADILWRKALEGNVQVGQYIFDRLDGKPQERIEHSESTVSQIVLVDGNESQGPAETAAVPDHEG